jgi:hypothetical protein
MTDYMLSYADAWTQVKPPVQRRFNSASRRIKACPRDLSSSRRRSCPVAEDAVISRVAWSVVRRTVRATWRRRHSQRRMAPFRALMAPIRLHRRNLAG